MLRRERRMLRVRSKIAMGACVVIAGTLTSAPRRILNHEGHQGHEEKGEERTGRFAPKKNSEDHTPKAKQGLASSCASCASWFNLLFCALQILRQPLPRLARAGMGAHGHQRKGAAAWPPRCSMMRLPLPGQGHAARCRVARGVGVVETVVVRKHAQVCRQAG
jgi:hypothetical protein